MPSALDLTWKEQPPVPSAAIMTNQLSRKRAHGPCHDASAVLPALAFCPIGSQKIAAYRLLTLTLKKFYPAADVLASHFGVYFATTTCPMVIINFLTVTPFMNWI